MTETRTAPHLYGTIYVVCEGLDEWCGREIEWNVEVKGDFSGTEERVPCPDCGAIWSLRVGNMTKAHYEAEKRSSGGL